MKKVSILVMFCMLTLTKASSEIVVRGAEAKKVFENVDVIRYYDGATNPNYIEFSPGKEPMIDDVTEWIRTHFDMPSGIELVFEKQETDQFGWTHYTLIQKLDEVMVEFAPIRVHAIGQRVQSLNGYFLHKAPDASFAISEQEALSAALEHVDAEKYMWDVKQEEDLLKLLTGSATASYFPKGEMVWMPMAEHQETGNTIPCWKFDVYAAEPEYRAHVYISAANGQFVYENHRLMHSDSAGIAHTTYSGTRNIVTDYLGSSGFRLYETSRANAIWTLNNNSQGGNWPNGIEFMDSDNVWLDTLHYSYATDVHWGVEMTWDYYMNVHGRNSVDGNGADLNSLVFYGTGSNNASWNGNHMRYLHGSSTNGPLTSLDVVGHEMTHGVIQYTCNLRYSDESGALNESFADIFGAAVEHYIKPDSVDNWTNGEDTGPFIRSMKDPNLRYNPDTYHGTFWYHGASDNGGVHTNSGVQNHWFYLLTEGGSGVNDLNNAFNVTGIGWTKSTEIAYQNMTYYLTTSPAFIDAEYETSRFFSIIAARNIYGKCTQEMISTWNAWYAVGLGTAYEPDIKADFNALTTIECLGFSKIRFTNTSNDHADSCLWDFGDGQTSALYGKFPPIEHTYASLGTYTVSLTVWTDSANACGAYTDVNTKTDYIKIVSITEVPESETVTCVNTSALIQANTPNDVYWYDNPFGTRVIFEGNPFVTEVLSADQTFYARAMVHSESLQVGPENQHFGTGSSYSGADDQWLNFVAYDNMVLDSVTVIATTYGTRTIELRQSSGSVIYSKSFVLDTGMHRLSLDFHLVPGLYRLGLDINDEVNLFRNTAGARYPYSIDNIVSIIGNSYSSGFYYYFYDWSVRKGTCQGNLVPMRVKMDYDPDCKPWYDGVVELQEKFEVAVFPNPARDRVNIVYALSKDQHLNISIIDVNGQLKVEAFNAVSSAGNHTIELNHLNLPKGLYFVRLVSEDRNETHKLMIQ